MVETNSMLNFCGGAKGLIGPVPAPCHDKEGTRDSRANSTLFPESL